MTTEELDSMINLGSKLEELQAKAGKALEEGTPELGHQTIEIFSELCVDYRKFQDQYGFNKVSEEETSQMNYIETDIDTYDVNRNSSDAAKIMAVENEYERIGDTSDEIIDNISQIVNPDYVQRMVGEACGYIRDEEENPEKPTLSSK